MRLNKTILCVLMSAGLVGSAAAQSNSLRGLSDSTPNRLPSAQQQLNQNLGNQKSGFSNRQVLDGAQKLNRTEQINRLNTRPGTGGTNCPSANAACNQGR